MRAENAVFRRKEVVTFPERSDKPLINDVRLYCCAPFSTSSRIRPRENHVRDAKRATCATRAHAERLTDGTKRVCVRTVANPSDGVTKYLIGAETGMYLFTPASTCATANACTRTQPRPRATSCSHTAPDFPYSRDQLPRRRRRSSSWSTLSVCRRFSCSQTTISSSYWPVRNQANQKRGASHRQWGF